MESGNGPFYMDCTGASDEDIAYMKHWLKHEGNMSILKYMEEEGIDLRKNPIEFQSYPIRGGGRLNCDEKAETSIKGLFAGGEEAYATISSAAVFGWIAGENAAKYVKTAASPDVDKGTFRIREIKDLINILQERKHGPDWRDANTALQHTMNDYAGVPRSRTMLEAGLAHLRLLKEKAFNTMKATNRWELTRCLEVLNLFEIGELVFTGALERKESRGLHQRTDYQFTDPLLNNKILVAKKVDGKPILEWREVQS